MSAALDTWTLDVAGGARLAVPASLAQISSYVLLEQEDWFEDEIRFVRRMLQPGMRAVDIGANLGVYAVAMARAVGTEGRVWAYEPAPATAGLLERNLALNALSQATAVRAALSDRPGTVNFSDGPHPELNGVAAPGAGIAVASTTIDAESRDWGDVDFLKLDVEGHEAQAIRGGERFFREASPLVMLEVKQSDDTIDLAPVDRLADLGYEAYRLLPGLMVLEPVDPLASQDRFQLNLFACKPERAKALAARGLLARGLAPPKGKASRKAWASFVRAAPYARGAGAAWRGPGWFSGEDEALYFEGLACWAQAGEPGLPAEERAGGLHRSLACLAEALQARDTLERRISYARAAADAGWRGAAVDGLALAADRMDGMREWNSRAPLLAPSAAHERLDAGAPFDWLQVSVLETLERLQAYSSYFSGEGALVFLAPLLAFEPRSIQTDRRVALVRHRAGLPPEPRVRARLAVPAADHRNAAFWGALS